MTVGTAHRVDRLDARLDALPVFGKKVRNAVDGHFLWLYTLED